MCNEKEINLKIFVDIPLYPREFFILSDFVMSSISLDDTHLRMIVGNGEERGVYRVLVGKPEGKRPLGRPRHRWVDNIRMDLQEVGCGYMD